MIKLEGSGINRYYKVMSFITRLIRVVSIATLVILQQGMIIGVGLIVYSQSSLVWGIAIWTLCIPMLYFNKKTYQLIMKHGLINFFTINADTSEIDVPKGSRWYDEDNSLP